MADDLFGLDIPDVDKATLDFMNDKNNEDEVLAILIRMQRLVEQQYGPDGLNILPFGSLNPGSVDPYLQALVVGLADNFFAVAKDLAIDERHRLAIMVHLLDGEEAIYKELMDKDKGEFIVSRSDAFQEGWNTLMTGSGSVAGGFAEIVEASKESTEVRFTFDGAYDFWVSSLGGDVSVRENLEGQKKAVHKQYRMDSKDSFSDAFKALPIDYLINFVQPTVTMTTSGVPVSGDIDLVASTPSIKDRLRKKLIAHLGPDFPIVESEGFTKAFNALAKQAQQVEDNSSAQLEYIRNKLQLWNPAPEYDENSGEYISPREPWESQMAELENVGENFMDAGVQNFPTPGQLDEQQRRDDEAKLLNTDKGRKGVVAKWLRENGYLTEANGLLDSSNLITSKGLDFANAVQEVFEEQWPGRATGLHWSGLLGKVMESDALVSKLSEKAITDAQELAKDKATAELNEYKRFTGLEPQQMVNEIATEMGLLTADTDPITLARLFGTSEASMSVMNQLKNKMATAPAGTDFKELVKEIIENIDSPQMRPDAPPGVPGTSAANQALYADYQKLLNDYNTSTLSEDVKGPRFQEALATLIRDNNLGVDIPTDGSPINQADVIMAITGQPMDITGIISGREERIGESPEDVAERKAAAIPGMQEAQSNLDALAAKHGINLDEYTRGTNAEIDAALAAFDAVSEPYLKALGQEQTRETEAAKRAAAGQPPLAYPSLPQAEGYIAPDPGAVSYGGEGQLTKEEWIEKFYPGKTEGVDLFIPEGQDTYTAPTKSEREERAEADVARVAEEAEAKRLKAEKIADTERRRLVALASAPIVRSRAVR